MDCDRFAEVAAELALGVLTGRERAEAIQQLDRCDGCREQIRRLTVIGEQLLGLLPAVTPPPGLERRILSELTPPAPSVRPTRRAAFGHAGHGGPPHHRPGVPE